MLKMTAKDQARCMFTRSGLLRQLRCVQVKLHGLSLDSFRLQHEARRNAAALKVQAAWRGRLSRIARQALLSAIHGKQQSAAAICIQVTDC